MSRRSRATEVGRKVGRYRLERPLGSGASATVYLARLEGEAGFARHVALKLVHAPLPFAEQGSAEEAEVGQPLVEARVASRIRHPNVVPVLDLGRDEDDRLYLVMEYVEGATLNAMLRRAAEVGTPLSLEVGLAVLDDLLAGLHAAHEARGDDGAPLDLVHRDVSPHNVIVGVDGVARLTDFGIAKVTDATQQTAAGIVKGKPGYMAPEQLRGKGIDRRTDVWAAGVIAWEVFAGKRLYRAKDLMSLSLEIITEMPPDLAEVRADVPDGIAHAVARALARDIGDRWDTAEELRLALAGSGVPRARREVVAACVRGDRAPAARTSGPSAVEAAPAAPSAAPSVVATASPAEEATATRLMPAPVERLVLSPSSPATFSAEGSTEATASVSMLEMHAARRSARIRGATALVVTVGICMTIFALASRASSSGSDASTPAVVSPLADPSPPSNPSPSVDAPQPPVAPPPVVAAEPVPSASAALRTPPPRPGSRAKPRTTAAPAPSGKLMGSPYR